MVTDRRGVDHRDARPIGGASPTFQEQSMSAVFEPIKVGTWELPQRFVMAPLTRNRAGEGEVPRDIAVTYYAQRAGAGLIVTEGTQPSAVGQGYLNTPGIHTPEQIAGWRAV